MEGDEATLSLFDLMIAVGSEGPRKLVLELEPASPCDAQKGKVTNLLNLSGMAGVLHQGPDPDRPGGCRGG